MDRFVVIQLYFFCNDVVLEHLNIIMVGSLNGRCFVDPETFEMNGAHTEEVLSFRRLIIVD
jgi:hypothetical protein